MSKVVAYAASHDERERISDALADGVVRVQTPRGGVKLPAIAAEAVRHLLAELAAGASVHVLADEAELTTQQAADLLGISRTYLVRLVDDGKIAAHLAGTHRRLYAAEVLAYQARRAERLADVADVTAADVAAGVPFR